MHEESCHMSFVLLITQVAITEVNHCPPIGRCMRNHQGRPLQRQKGWAFGANAGLGAGKHSAFPCAPRHHEIINTDRQLWWKYCASHRFASAFGKIREKGPRVHRLFGKVKQLLFLFGCRGDGGPAVGMLGTYQGSGQKPRSIWMYRK